jgi:hypothetical protein
MAETTLPRPPILKLVKSDVGPSPLGFAMRLDILEGAGTIVAEGRQVLGDMSRSINQSRHKYLTDTVEVASFGSLSSTEDLAKLTREFKKALASFKYPFS